MSTLLNIIRWFAIRLVIIALVMIAVVVVVTVYVENTDSLVIPLNDNAALVCGYGQIESVTFGLSRMDRHELDNVTYREIGSNCIVLTGVKVTTRSRGITVQVQ